MIRSLTTENTDQTVNADVHVIGAGIAGLLIATRLARRGLHVVVTESGDHRQEGESHPLNEVVHARATYRGAETGRARCLGGTSTLWGGAMIPFLAADMKAGHWPLERDALLHYMPELERLFGLPNTPYEASELVPSINGQLPFYIPRLAKWPAFGRRNVATLLGKDIATPDGASIWLNATATKFAFTSDGRVASITAEAPNGHSLTVVARQVIIAAGAVESTRLLLLADRQADARIFAPDNILGRYFHDHLSVLVGSIEPIDRTALNRLAGFRFEGGGMRNLRFEPNETSEVRAQVPAGFAHIAFANREGSGFDALRNLLRLLQQRKLPNAATLLPLVRGAPWLARAVWWRLREQRLLYPGDADIELHMVIEQQPRSDNRILLSPDRVDSHGQPLALIDWSPHSIDEQNLTSSTDLFVKYWQQTILSQLGSIKRRAAGEAEMDLAKGGGIYHPGGSTRMGTTAENGVVDANLATFRLPNLSVASTSVFPTGGGTNPTMMLMLAAMRLADHIPQ